MLSLNETSSEVQLWTFTLSSDLSSLRGRRKKGRERGREKATTFHALPLLLIFYAGTGGDVWHVFFLSGVPAGTPPVVNNCLIVFNVMWLVGSKSILGSTQSQSMQLDEEPRTADNCHQSSLPFSVRHLCNIRRVRRRRRFWNRISSPELASPCKTLFLQDRTGTIGRAAVWHGENSSQIKRVKESFRKVKISYIKHCA